MSARCMVYNKSCASLADVESGTVKMAVTSLPDMKFYVDEVEEEMKSASSFLLYNRFFVIDKVWPMLRPLANELHRVLKDDGCFVLDAGSVAKKAAPGFGLLMPLMLAEFIVTQSPLSFHADFIIEQVASEEDGLIMADRDQVEAGIVSTHEHLLLFTKNGKRPVLHVPPGETLPSVWHYEAKDRLEKDENQKWQQLGFSIRVVAQLLRLFTEEGDVVLDPCAGLGSLWFAAKQMNRDCILYEVEPRLMPVIQRIGGDITVKS